MPVTGPPQPPAIVVPAPAVDKKVTITPDAKQVIAVAQEAAPRPVSDAAIRAAFVTQAGVIKASEQTADATRKAAETSAHYAFIAACLALVGAVFGGLVAWRNGWLTTRTTQQVKHADYRQSWIDKLREEMARFTRLASEFKDPELRESLSIIVLRMDKDDPEYDELTRLMQAIAGASSSKNLTALANNTADFLEVSQRILKREWEVTKHDMHTTPWGRPISWFVNRHRRRRRREEKEVVRRERAKLPLTPPREIKILRWPFQWRRRQLAPLNPQAPVFRIGRFEIRKRLPK